MAINFRKRFLELGETVDIEFLDKYLDLVLDYPGYPGYSEGHHILPRSLFPDYARDSENITALRGRDHLYAHYLLARALPRNPSMANAYLAMVGRDQIPANLKLGHGHHLGDDDIPCPTEELARQYEESRRVWSDFMKTQVTVKVKATGEAIQIPKELFDPEAHAHLTEGYTTYRNTKGETVYLPVNHRDVLSGRVKHVNKGTFTFLDTHTGEMVKLTKEEFQNNPHRYQALRKGESSRPNRGKTAVIVVATNDFKWVPKDDPELEENLKTGVWKYPFKGKLTVRDAQGNKLSVDKDDPRIASGELVPTSKGMATVVDASGNSFQVPKDDPRIASGELLPQNKGRIRAVDQDGNEMRVYPDDPRLATGELVEKILMKNRGVPKIRVWDDNGKEWKFWPDDPRVATMHRSKKDVPGWVDTRIGRPRGLK